MSTASPDGQVCGHVHSLLVVWLAELFFVCLSRRSHVFIDQEAPDFIDTFNMTMDYNPDDIDHINVNELLLN